MLRIINKKYASHFRRETAIENKNVKGTKTLIIDQTKLSRIPFKSAIAVFA